MALSIHDQYSTTRPPLFKGTNFSYWRNRMEYFLTMDIEIWFTIQEGFKIPIGEDGEPLELDKWSIEQKKKG